MKLSLNPPNRKGRGEESGGAGIQRRAQNFIGEQKNHLF
jgi:hypothetical protein